MYISGTTHHNSAQKDQTSSGAKEMHAGNEWKYSHWKRPIKEACQVEHNAPTGGSEFDAFHTEQMENQEETACLALPK